MNVNSLVEKSLYLHCSTSPGLVQCRQGALRGAAILISVKSIQMHRRQSHLTAVTTSVVPAWILSGSFPFIYSYRKYHRGT